MSVRVVASAVAGILLGAATAHAQLPGFDVHLGVRGGYFTPLGIVTEDAQNNETQLSTGLGIGATLELDIPLSPINVRGNFAATFGRSLEAEGQGALGGEVDIMVLTGDLVFRPIPRLVLAQPYLLLGAGIKRYSTDGAVDEGTDFTGHIGAGADMNLAGISLMVEINDYISAFQASPGEESHLQNDIFIMAGIRIGLF